MKIRLVERPSASPRRTRCVGAVPSSTSVRYRNDSTCHHGDTMFGGRNEWLRSVCIGCSKFASPVYFALTCAWYTRRSVESSARSMKSTIAGCTRQPREQAAAVERELAAEPVLFGTERGPGRRHLRISAPQVGVGAPGRPVALGIGVELLRAREHVPQIGGGGIDLVGVRRDPRAEPSRRSATPRPRRRKPNRPAMPCGPRITLRPYG